jgi:hypothetical protein
MEDRSPLEGRTMSNLTSATMTVFGVERSILFEDVGVFPTEAFATPLDRSKSLLILILVWGTVFPMLVFEGVFWDSVGECWTGDGILCRFNAHFRHDECFVSVLVEARSKKKKRRDLYM